MSLKVKAIWSQVAVLFMLEMKSPEQSILVKFFTNVLIFLVILLLANTITLYQIGKYKQLVFDTTFFMVGIISFILLKVLHKWNSAIHFFIFAIAIVQPMNVYQAGGLYTIQTIWVPTMYLLLIFLSTTARQLLASQILIFGSILAIAISFYANPSNKTHFQIDKNELFFAILLQIVLVWYVNKKRNELNKELLQKEKEDNLKNVKLISILCHDIANPVHNIQSATSDDLKDELDKKELLEIIKISANAASDIIESVREHRSIIDGKKAFTFTKVNLKALVEQSLKILNFTIVRKQMRFDLDIPKDIYLQTDPVILQNNVINNLITNSVKFSSTNATVRIKAYQENTTIIIQVRDFGIGIPKTILKSIFDISKATTRPGTEGESGTGYGMPLVYSSVQKLGGKIDIESWVADEKTQQTGTQVTLYF
ncbi:MAG: HAMP domain-containing sensor histidine kinase [Spirochaetota bacterium]